MARIFKSYNFILFFKLQIFVNAVVVVKSYRNINVSLTYHIINQNYLLNDGGFKKKIQSTHMACFNVLTLLTTAFSS